MAKHMFSRPRRRNSATAAKEPATPSANVNSAGISTGYQGRWVFIRNKVGEALKAILANQKYDWAREPSETISEHAETLVLTMIGYAEDKKDEVEVKGAYTSYVQTYLRETP